MKLEERQKLVQICKSLSGEEQRELFLMLKDKFAPEMITLENYSKTRDPMAREEIEYEGKLIDY